MNKNIDYKKWEDRGWDNMHTLLDLHLPRKRNRRMFWFMLLSGGLIVSTAAYYALQYNPQENKIIPGSTKQNSTTTEIKHQGNTSALNEKSTDSIHSNDKYLESPNSIFTSLDIRKVNKVAENGFPGRSVSMQSKKEFQTNMIEQNSKGLQTIESNSTNYNDDIPDIDADKPIGDFRYFALASIPLEQIPIKSKFTDLENVLPAIQLANKITMAKKHKLELGLQTGMQVYMGNISLSNSLGFLIRKKFSSAWSVDLSPGIEWKRGNFILLNTNEYNYIASMLDSIKNNTRFFSDIENFDPGNNPSTSNPGVQSLEVATTKNLFTAHLPVCLTYHYNRHWQFSGGMKFSVPLHHQFLSASKSDIIEWKNNSISHWKVNPVNAFAFAGISYFPIYSFGFSLSYTFAPDSPVAANNLNHGSATFHWLIK